MSDLKRLSNKDYKIALHKLKKFDVDPATDLLANLYSTTGRPANDPNFYLRSFILMFHLGYYSIHKWCDHVTYDTLLQYLLGIDFTNPNVKIPNASSHYDFIKRLTNEHPSKDTLHRKDFYKKPKDKDKPKKGEKLQNTTKELTVDVKEKYINDLSCDNDRKERFIEVLFDVLAVKPSILNGFINLEHMILSGDGSSLHIHARNFGRKQGEGEESDEIYKFTAEYADIGWDSDLGLFYLGHTFYNIAYHDKDRAYDLPLYMCLDKASKHDSLNCMIATARMLEINPALKPEKMCFDSASDALSVYQFLIHFGIDPYIDRNKRRKCTNQDYEANNLTENGYPTCKAGLEMKHNGHCKSRHRTKFRCPLAPNNIDQCPLGKSCTKNNYGRTVYLLDKDTPRNACSDKYK